MHPSVRARGISCFAAAAIGIFLAAASLRAGETTPTVVNGVVRDGSGQGWPLYAMIVVSGPGGFPGATVFTDPLTGFYTITLDAGATYGFTVTAMTSGYSPGGGSLTIAAANLSGSVVANWSLAAAPACTAPGYTTGNFVPPLVLSENFGGGSIPSGWSVDTASGVSWAVYSGADPCGQFENNTGGSGPYAVLNSSCFSDGSTNDDSSLVTPPMDLTGRSNAAIRWANDFIDEGFGSTAMVDVSVDGGANWTNIWQAPGDLPGPNTQIADLSLAAGHADVLARFHYQGFWAWWWEVDNVFAGTYACTPIPGGLVVGTVSDANTGAGLNGATVKNIAGGAPATTIATPGDPNLSGGYYALFSDSAAQSFEASYPAYHPQTESKTVVPNATTRADFSLASGLLAATPNALAAVVAPGSTQVLPLDVTNSGTGSGSFVIQEVNAPPASQTPDARARARFANAADRNAALRRVPFGRLKDKTSKDLPALPKAPAGARRLAAGNLVASFPSGLASGWGLAYDTDASRLWISNPDAPFSGFSGDGLEYQYLPDGTQTGDTVDIHATGGDWQADGTYDGRTGKIWQVNVGGDNCLFEIDPVAKAVTGAKICGPWTTPQRAVAYDYATDTFYVGGPNEAVVYHLDTAGNLLDSAYVGFLIYGLAYNPTTHHLFINQEFPSPFQIWVLDTRANYAVVGGISVTSAGLPALPNGAVSLEADCDGRLWVLDDTAQIVYGFESGETGWCVNDIPWLAEDPTQGTLPGSGGSLRQGGGASLPVEVTFDSTGLLPGLRQGSLIFQTAFAPAMPPVPVDFTVLFNDVPQGSFAWNYIYGAAGSGVMPGCAPQTPTFSFCPAQPVTRRSMAGFIERAVHGALTPPPVYLGEFDDVLSGSFNANYIQGLLDDRITAGCGVSPPLYCPDVPVTRAQMAVFVWKAQHGDEPPPACVPPGTFADVACPGGFAVDYVEGIFAEGVTAGCGSGNYCPDASITNAQMAVYLVKAFSLPYLP